MLISQPGWLQFFPRSASPTLMQHFCMQTPQSVQISNVTAAPVSLNLEIMHNSLSLVFGRECLALFHLKSPQAYNTILLH